MKTLKDIEASDSPINILMGTPIHCNMGDHLIAKAETDLLKRLDPDRKLIEIPTEMYVIYRTKLKMVIPEDSSIYITGGGWMGDLWPIEEQVIQSIVNDYKERKIIVFPQTIYYSDINKNFALEEKAKKIYNAAHHLIIAVRDKASYEYALKHYPKASVLLCPDIALSLPRVKDEICHTNHKKITVGKCLRNDRELISTSVVDEILKYFKSKFLTEYVDISTINDVPVSVKNRENAICALIKRFMSVDVVITNRLHGMIYAYLTRKPCIALDNKTGKVYGVYSEWLRNCSGILFVHNDANATEIKDAIDTILNNVSNDANIDFMDLIEVISHG